MSFGEAECAGFCVAQAVCRIAQWYTETAAVTLPVLQDAGLQLARTSDRSFKASEILSF